MNTYFFSTNSDNGNEEVQAKTYSQAANILFEDSKVMRSILKRIVTPEGETVYSPIFPTNYDIRDER
jgi:hypothetical protein